MVESESRNLTSRHTLATSAAWNVGGSLLPLLIAFIALPILIETLGLERFGVLTLVWLVVGYFGLFDLGVGRALTKTAAELLATGENRKLADSVVTGVLLAAGLGIVGGFALAAFASVIVGNLLTLPAFLESEAFGALLLLAAGIPVVTSSSVYRGTLEALQRFDAVNVIRVPMSAGIVLVPLLLATSGYTDLRFLTTSIVAVRIVAMLLYRGAMRRSLQSTGVHGRPSVRSARTLVTLGSWMTISNVISPMMVILDRFVIAAAIGVAAVSVYSAPFELITKTMIVPVALMAVAFPAFSTKLASDRPSARRLYIRSIGALGVVMVPVVLVGIFGAERILVTWLGTDFPRQAVTVLRVLSVGVVFNAVAQAPFSLLQADGRPDLVAKLHLLELPFYVATLFILMRHAGLEGAAWAWTIRVAADFVALAVLAGRRFSAVGRPGARTG